MPKTATASTQTKPQLRRQPGEAGYWLDGDFRQGFPDDPSLPDGLRRRIAAWAEAYTPDQVSDEQRSLLANRPEREASPAQRDAAALASVEATPLWQFLSDLEQQLVRDPGTHPDLDPETRYPLAIGEFTTLTSTTEKQVRYWAELGLLPIRRRESGHRSFYAAASIRAFVYRRLPQAYLTVLRNFRSDETARLLAAMATLARDLGSEAKNAPPPDDMAKTWQRLLVFFRQLSEAPDMSAALPLSHARHLSDGLVEVRLSKRDRLVMPSDDGTWRIVKPQASRASEIAPTQKQAISRAREIVKHAGGGTVLIHDKAGAVKSRQVITCVDEPIRARRRPSKP